MTYEDFYKEINEKYYIQTLQSPFSYSKKTEKIGDYIDSWTIGGSTGRSCYSDSSYGVDVEQEENTFQTMILKYIPDIKLSEYIDIVENCVKIVDQTKHEYYGNYYENRYRIIDFEKLYERIKHRL